MSMKLFPRLPKPYKFISIVIITAFTMVSVGLFVNALLPVPEIASSSPNTETASGISITPVNPNGQNAPAVNGLPSSAAPSTASQPRDAAPPVSEASSTAGDRIPNPSDIDAYAEPYDDLPTTADLPGLQYGHFAYKEANPADLDSVGLFVRESYEREETLDYEATAAFAKMKADAAVEGVFLMPISGFRTYEHQAELFAKQIEKRGSEAAAAKLSAPPGHSEHHTGFAIDIADVNSPDTDIKYSFENTPAYSWLVGNARRYGFEQSFPKNNQQGVSFEPWHWRFVDSDRANEVFINSKSVFPVP